MIALEIQQVSRLWVHPLHWKFRKKRPRFFGLVGHCGDWPRWRGWALRQIV